MAHVKETGKLFGRSGALFGIVTEPASGPQREPAVVILNSGIIHRTGPSRFAVGLARLLAAAGYRVLRFDLSGIGDSPLASEHGELEEIVRLDVADAITLMDSGAGVVLTGICSGADNSFLVAADDARVRGLVLIDPHLYETEGFRRRRLRARLLSPRSWWNILSGRSFWLRLIERIQGEQSQRPPGYYGALSYNQEQDIERARRMSERGVRFLYVLTGGALEYCNHPQQVVEALPDAFAPSALAIEWQPEMGHTLPKKEHRELVQNRIKEFMVQFG